MSRFNMSRFKSLLFCAGLCGSLLGFAPTGEPDNTDPNLVNKLQ